MAEMAEQDIEAIEVGPIIVANTEQVFSDSFTFEVTSCAQINFL